MRVLITGGAGFIGRKLATRLLADGTLRGRGLTGVTLFDVVAADASAGEPRLTTVGGDIADLALVERLLAPGFDVIYHLAAVVSSAAEADFDLGMRVNLDGTRNLLEVARRQGNRPLLVFASSCAVYGGPLPPVVRDDTHAVPQSSYGAQKAACELIVNDHGRRGHVDARSLRLPTIVVRPGRPNKAASSFASSIFREPLNGEEATCPVPLNTALYVLSPARVVDALVRAAEIDAVDLDRNRTLLLPGLTMTVAEGLEALGRIAGKAVVDRVIVQPDPAIASIVASWPARFDAARARRLGFLADADLTAILRQHIDDERSGSFAA